METSGLVFLPLGVLTMCPSYFRTTPESNTRAKLPAISLGEDQSGDLVPPLEGLAGGEGGGSTLVPRFLSDF